VGIGVESSLNRIGSEFASDSTWRNVLILKVASFQYALIAASIVLVLAKRWWLRPSLQDPENAVVVGRLRPVAVPRSMIAEMIGPGGRSRRGGYRLLLVNGEVVRWRERPQVATNVDALSCNQRLQATSAGDRDRRSDFSRSPRKRGRARRRLTHLPDDTLVSARARLTSPGSVSVRQFYVTMLLVPLLFPLFAMFPESDNGTRHPRLPLGAVGKLALLTWVPVAIWLALRWRRETRTIAVGPTWIAWRSRLALSWRVLPFSEVVSTMQLPGQRPEYGMRLSRADGTALRLRLSDLFPNSSSASLGGVSDVGAVLKAQLAEHPAMLQA
jgi:hypothetical protein